MVVRFSPVVYALVLGILLSPSAIPCFAHDHGEMHATPSLPCESHDDENQDDPGCGCPCHLTTTGIPCVAPILFDDSLVPNFPVRDERLVTRFLEPDLPPPRV